jgi:hypothetical protein
LFSVFFCFSLVTRLGGPTSVGFFASSSTHEVWQAVDALSFAPMAVRMLEVAVAASASVFNSGDVGLVILS